MPMYKTYFNHSGECLCPCKGCKDRKVSLDYNCHSHCKKFMEWKDKDQERKENEKKAQNSVPRYINWNSQKRW